MNCTWPKSNLLQDFYDVILYNYIMDYQKIKHEDLFWLIGWLEAEGSFTLINDRNNRSPQVGGCCKDKDIMDRVCAILQCNQYLKKVPGENYAQQYAFQVRKLEIGSFFLTIQKFFSNHRQKQITRALSKMRPEELNKFELDISLQDKHLLEWLTGYLDGEGCFLVGERRQPNMSKISLQTSDEDMAKKVAGIFEVKYDSYQPKKPNRKLIYRVRKEGRGAIEWMLKLKPGMSIRRQLQIERAVKAYNPQPIRRKWSKFTKEEWQQIKDMRNSGTKIMDLAEQFNVNHTTISELCNGKSYKCYQEEFSH